MSGAIEKAQLLAEREARKDALEDDLDDAREELALVRRPAHQRAALWALGFGIAGGAGGVAMWLLNDAPVFAVFFPLVASTFGAMLGAAETLKANPSRPTWRTIDVP